MTDTPKIILEGPLMMWESEGGFAPSGIEVGDQTLEGELRKLFGDISEGRGLESEVWRPGMVRITIERLTK